MLAGSDDFVKADRMLCRFTANAVNRELKTDEVESLVIEALESLIKSTFRILPRAS
jgi:hypothetical protein